MDWTIKLEGGAKGSRATFSQQGETRHVFDDLPPVTAMASLAACLVELAKQVGAKSIPPVKNETK